jgi:hypothetical protein
MQKRWFLTAFALLVVVAGAVQAKPNFSGDWKLNVEKSDFGPMPPPTTLTMKVDHTDPEVKVTTAMSGAQGDMTVDATYNTEGKETTNQFGPMQSKSTANWEGDDLVVNTKLDANGTEITIKGKWTLSADGKTLTQASHINSPQGDLDLKYVLEKQTK